MSLAAGITCLALVAFHEARGESDRGQTAVALVTVNRVKSGEYSKDVCSVVYQKDQYTWTKHKSRMNRKAVKRDQESWKKSLTVAKKVMNGEVRDFTNGALNFRRATKKDKRSKNILVIGNHAFIKRKHK